MAEKARMHATGNSRAIWDHSVTCHLQRWDSRFYPQPKQTLDLATAEGCKAELMRVHVGLMQASM